MQERADRLGPGVRFYPQDYPLTDMITAPEAGAQ